MKRLKISGTVLFSYILFALSAVILLSTLVFTLNIHVLKDWHLTLPTGDIHAGDTITVSSSAIKLHSVTGTSKRYLVCVNNQGDSIKYLLSSGIADNSPGQSNGGFVVTLPTKLTADTTLPTTCHIFVNVRYQVYPWRVVTEFTQSSDFTLLPQSSQSPVSSVVTSVHTNQSQGSSGSQVQAGGTSQNPSSSNSTPFAPSEQSKTSQPSSPSPNFIQELITPVQSLLGGL